jgi:hypothetical protein
MADDNFKSQLAALFPDKLDDIIKSNRNELRLEYVQVSEITAFEKELPTSPIKAVLEDAFIYKRIITLSVKEPICLVGFSRDEVNCPRHTSAIRAYDPAKNIFQTNTGSLYQVKNFVEGEAHQNLLLHICASAWSEGWGEHFGVPNIFY